MIEMLKDINGPRYVEINDQEIINSDVKKIKHPRVIENYVWKFNSFDRLYRYFM